MIIVFGKSIAAFAIVRAFAHPTQTALAVSASLAQIGEFSFILAGLGTGLGLLPEDGRDLILAGAIFSILLNPVIFAVVAGRTASLKKSAAVAAAALETEREREREDHVILVGYGTVGRLVARGTREIGRALVIIEDQPDIARRARDDGLEVVIGNATDPHVLSNAGIEKATKMLIAIPEGFEGGAIAESARRLNPDLMIIARAHSDAEVSHLRRLGANHVIMGEREIANQVLKLAATVR